MAESEEPAEANREKRPPLLVFVDIPGSAGASLTIGLPPALTHRWKGPPLPEILAGGGGISPMDLQELREAIKSVRMRVVRKLRGGFPLTIADVLRQELGSRPVRYITFLRDPCDRTLAEHADTPAAEGMTPVEALDAGLIYDNLQTRMLSGSLDPSGPASPGMLDQAKRNLREQLAFFGIAELLEESLCLARLRLGLPSTVYRNESALGRTPTGNEVPAELRAQLMRRNEYDAELYDYARELFAAAPEFAQLSFVCEVAAVRTSLQEGDIEVVVPAPETYTGGEEAWELMVRARAEAIRLEWDLEQLEYSALAGAGAAT